jgi:hypothetical protein
MALVLSSHPRRKLVERVFRYLSVLAQPPQLGEAPILNSRHGYSAAFASIIFTPLRAMQRSNRAAKSSPFIEATATADNFGASNGSASTAHGMRVERGSRVLR